MPYDLDTFFFWNSGAEAVEAAIKLARHATKRPNVIVFQGGYHGRTIGTMSLTTSKRIYRAGYGPLMPGVHVAPFPYVHQWQNSFVGDAGAVDAHDVESRCVAHALEQLELVFKQQADPNEVAAMIIEPVQGEVSFYCETCNRFEENGPSHPPLPASPIPGRLCARAEGLHGRPTCDL